VIILAAYLVTLFTAAGLGWYALKLHQEALEWEQLAEHREAMAALDPEHRRAW
jgi:hypothetical protein